MDLKPRFASGFYTNIASNYVYEVIHSNIKIE